MKKVLALLLVLALMPCIAFAEEGNLYDGEITFMGFAYGATRQEVTKKINGNTKHDWGFFPAQDGETYAAYTRELVDEMTMVDNSSFGRKEDNGQKYTIRDIAYSGDAYNVAGYDVKSVVLYFAYPNDGTQVNRSADDAVFYAGQYVFDGNKYPIGEAMFDDLKGKLAAVYGATFSEGSTLDAVFGEPDWERWKEWYGESLTYEEYLKTCREGSGLKSQYAVWKSAVNDGIIVLELNLGYSENIRLTYLWQEGDEVLKASVALESGDGEPVPDQFGNGDTSGL